MASEIECPNCDKIIKASWSHISDSDALTCPNCKYELEVTIDAYPPENKEEEEEEENV